MKSVKNEDCEWLGELYSDKLGLENGDLDGSNKRCYVILKEAGLIRFKVTRQGSMKTLMEDQELTGIFRREVNSPNAHKRLINTNSLENPQILTSLFVYLRNWKGLPVTPVEVIPWKSMQSTSQCTGQVEKIRTIRG